MTTIPNAFRSLKQYVIDTPVDQLTVQNLEAQAATFYRNFAQRKNIYLTDLSDIAHEVGVAKGKHLLKNILTQSA